MGKFLLSLFCLLVGALSSSAATKTYQLTTDLSEITNSNNKFIIVTSKPLGGSLYAVKSSTTSTIGTTEILSSATGLPETLSIDDTDLGIFTVKDNGETYKALYETTKQVYYGAGTSSTNMAVSTSLPTNNQYQLTITLDGNKVKVGSQKTTTRFFSFQKGTSGALFKNYASSNITDDSDTYCYPAFYKEVEIIGPTTPAYSNVPADGEFKMIIGESKSLPEITPTELSYSFATTDTNIIEIDNATKTVKALEKGTATVSFTTEAVEDKYLTGNGSFQVTISGKPAEISFQHRNVEGKLGTGVVWQTAIVKEPAGATVKYTATDPNSGEVSDVLRIDETTGVINPDDILKVGSALITATTAATDEYEEGKATYIITISDPNSAESPTSTTTIDFTKAGAYGLTTYASSNTSSYATEKVQKSEPPVSFTLEGRYMLKYESGTSGATLLNLPRLTTNNAAAGEITISVPTDGTENAIITRIIFIGGTNLDKLSSDTEGGTYSGENHRWDLTEGQEVSTVHFKNTGKSGANIQKIEILWQSKNSNLKPAELSFPQKIYNAEEGIEFEANAVTTPNAVGEITYEIDDCPNGSVVENGGKLKITIPEVGSYTLKATSKENAEFRSGLAIMRINVFPNLTPTVDNGTFSDNEIKSESNIAYAKFDVNPQLRLYYLVSETVLDTPDVYDFDEYDPTTGIELSGNGNLYYYLGNFGYNSPIKTVKYNVGPTGVVEIATDSNGAVRIFDLNGREIKGTPEKGVYIRIQNGKATKVVI